MVVNLTTSRIQAAGRGHEESFGQVLGGGRNDPETGPKDKEEEGGFCSLLFCFFCLLALSLFGKLTYPAAEVFLLWN